jgi:hypothetical protein
VHGYSDDVGSRLLDAAHGIAHRALSIQIWSMVIHLLCKGEMEENLLVQHDPTSWPQ